jgi:hypothetical protein
MSCKSQDIISSPTTVKLNTVVRVCLSEGRLWITAAKCVQGRSKGVSCSPQNRNCQKHTSVWTWSSFQKYTKLTYFYIDSSLNKTKLNTFVSNSMKSGPAPWKCNGYTLGQYIPWIHDARRLKTVYTEARRRAMFKPSEHHTSNNIIHDNIRTLSYLILYYINIFTIIYTICYRDTHICIWRFPTRLHPRNHIDHSTRCTKNCWATH